MSELAHIKFRNKSEYSITHMFNPTLVKLAMHELSQLWLNSKSIPLDWEYITDISRNELLLLYLPFMDQYPWVLFFLSHSLQRTHSLMRWLSFFLSESQVPSSFSFVPSRTTRLKSLSEKIIIKTLSSILYHRWTEIE